MAAVPVRRRAALLAVCAALLLVVPAGRLRAQQEEPSSPRAGAPLTILQINDVYSTVPVDGAGGLARVAALKQQLAAAGRTPLVVMAGDFLSPSVASSVFKGEQMVAALNAAGLDLATIGNHEFDFGVDVLLARMAQSRFQYVVSNVIDTRTGKPMGDALPYLVRDFGPLKVGFIGLCLTTSELSPDKVVGVRLIDPAEAAATYLPILKREGANVIVAITHLAFADDEALVERFPEIDLVIGGHEHYPIAEAANGTLISKAGTDARWVARIDLTRRSSGAIGRFYELLPMTSAVPEEPHTAEVVASYETRLSKELDAVVGASLVPLDADAVRLRASETNLGDLVADAMREAVKADAAIVNAGTVRGDRVYPPGPLTRRTVLAMHPFGGVVCAVATPGRVILEALENGVAKMPATAGQFPQVSGLTLSVNPRAPAGMRVSDVRIGGQPIDPEKLYTIAVTDYQLKGGDGYGMLAGQRVLVGPEAGDLIVIALEKYITAHGEISPAIDGRIRIFP